MAASVLLAFLAGVTGVGRIQDRVDTPFPYVNSCTTVVGNHWRKGDDGIWVSRFEKDAETVTILSVTTKLGPSTVVIEWGPNGYPDNDFVEPDLHRNLKWWITDAPQVSVSATKSVRVLARGVAAGETEAGLRSLSSTLLTGKAPTEEPQNVVSENCDPSVVSLEFESRKTTAKGVPVVRWNVAETGETKPSFESEYSEAPMGVVERLEFGVNPARTFDCNLTYLLDLVGFHFEKRISDLITSEEFVLGRMTWLLGGVTEWEYLDSGGKALDRFFDKDRPTGIGALMGHMVFYQGAKYKRNGLLAAKRGPSISGPILKLRGAMSSIVVKLQSSIGRDTSYLSEGLLPEDLVFELLQGNAKFAGKASSREKVETVFSKILGLKKFGIRPISESPRLRLDLKADFKQISEQISKLPSNQQGAAWQGVRQLLEDFYGAMVFHAENGD